MTRLYFAYDGTIHGDWVAQYAMRMASHLDEPVLRLLHIDEGKLARDELERRLDRLRIESQRNGVTLEVELRPNTDDAFRELLNFVPPGKNELLICGTRVRPTRAGGLNGTVVEQLLRGEKFSVLALRVVQPGVLGVPLDFLLPVSGHPRGLQLAIPFLKLFARDIARLHLLMVKQTPLVSSRLLPHAVREQMRSSGQLYLQRLERELLDAIALPAAGLDATVVVSDDVASEIMQHANRTKSRLIVFGASERTFAQRVLRAGPIERVLRETPCDVAIYRGVP